MYAQSHAVPWTQEYDQEQSYTRRLTHALLSWAETQRDWGTVRPPKI